MLDVDFRLNLTKRMHIVRLVEAGQLQPNVPHNSDLIRLPVADQHLSKGGGDIVVHRRGTATVVLFFTYRGVLDNYAGFVYRSDNHAVDEADFGTQFWEITKLREHWFWVAST